MYTFAVDGCWWCAFTNGYNSIVGTNYNPKEMCDLLKSKDSSIFQSDIAKGDNATRIAKMNTAMDDIQLIRILYPSNTPQELKKYYINIINELNAGNPVLLHFYVTPSSGHTVLLNGINADGDVMIVDSDGTAEFYSLNEIYNVPNARTYAMPLGNYYLYSGATAIHKKS